MDVRVERLDTAVEALRESGDLAHLGDGDAEFGEALGGRAGGHHFGAGLDEGLGQYFDAFLMKTETSARRIGRFVLSSCSSLDSCGCDARNRA